MELTNFQKEIISGKICPYCHLQSEYIDSSFVYGKSYGMIYICKACDAYCGVHKGTENALGRLANKDLRYWKKQAHEYFDIIWKEKHETRSDLYKHLSLYLEIPSEFTHIGMFGVETCKEVVSWSKMRLNDLRRLDMDFGIEVKRPHYET